jgi:ATP-binding cassette subfamily B protein
MTSLLERVSWSESQLGEGIVRLVQAAGLARDNAAEVHSGPLQNDAALADLGERLGVDIDSSQCNRAQLSAALAGLGPSILRIEHAAGRGYLLMLSTRARSVTVLTPALSRQRVRQASLHTQLACDLDREWACRTDAWLAGLGLSPKQMRRVRATLWETAIGPRAVAGLWTLRADVGDRFLPQLRGLGVLRRLAGACGLSVMQLACAAGAGLVIGRAELRGVLEHAWLLAFVLASLSSVPLQLAAFALWGRAVHDSVALLKRRLFCGALRLPLAALRRRGAARLLAMIAEADALESVAQVGAFQVLPAILQLAAAAVALGLGAGGGLHAISLLLFCSCVAWLVHRHTRRRADWTERRLELARGFVEHARGHRTRAVQRDPALWHDQEDGALDGYVRSSRRLDPSSNALDVLPARAWLLVGALGFLPAWLSGSGPDSTSLALGGTLLAYGAFATLGSAVGPLTTSWVAWRQLRELYEAASLRPPAGRTHLERPPVSPGAPLLDIRGLSFGHPQQREPVLRDVALCLCEGERLLLGGVSGGGKSTLAALIGGLSSPWSGHVLVRGLDRATLGDRAWKRCVASAPQFHENHVLSASLAFNLLMGRQWPPSAADIQAAEAICRELDLSQLIARMPNGLDQWVGETGWQLSHGERSRLFLARALLQDADVVILDESFGTLDPLTLRRCVAAVVRRAGALIVIGHT